RRTQIVRIAYSAARSLLLRRNIFVKPFPVTNEELTFRRSVIPTHTTGLFQLQPALFTSHTFTGRMVDLREVRRERGELVIFNLQSPDQLLKLGLRCSLRRRYEKKCEKKKIYELTQHRC